MRLVCATANPHKVTELSRMLPEWVQLVARPSEVGDVEETAPRSKAMQLSKPWKLPMWQTNGQLQMTQA